MHGASVRRTEYAEPLRHFVTQTFRAQDLPVPNFYSGFWGDVLGESHQLWDWVNQDLETFRWHHPHIDTEDILHYYNRRKQFVTEFFSDIFNYLNPRTGQEVRKVIALQLLNFIKSLPEERDIHIVAHSLSSVILWDILFSDQFRAGDPAFYIRDAIKGLSPPSRHRKVILRSITTLGSPLLFFNRLLDIQPEQLKQFASRYRKQPLRWVNIVHASDVFAYPIRASLDIDSNCPVYVRDKYLGDRNFLKKRLKKRMGDVTMALGLVSDHSGYWKHPKVSRLATANLLGDCNAIDTTSPF